MRTWKVYSTEFQKDDIFLWKNAKHMEFIDVLKWLLIINLIFVLVWAVAGLYYNKFQNYSSFIPVYGIITSSIAAFIAVLAYKKNSLRPNLHLRIHPYQQTDEIATLAVNSSNEVIPCRPHNEWSVILWNHGEASGKYPMVMMEFRGAAFKEIAFKGWKAVKHAHGRGYYIFQWVPDNLKVIYPGFSMQLPTLYFSKHRIENDFEVEFKCVADGTKSKSLTIPVRVNKRE